jgi:hypothetical protein
MQDSAQLDFVALLSCVGEDILLPDELACPEYIISSELSEKVPVPFPTKPQVLLLLPPVSVRCKVPNIRVRYSVAFMVFT